jgi:hypothetical protein
MPLTILQRLEQAKQFSWQREGDAGLWTERIFRKKILASHVSAAYRQFHAHVSLHSINREAES